MRQDIAELWAQAVESGNYRQTSGRLHTDEGYCCLGVLCELAVASGLGIRVERIAEGFHAGSYAYANNNVVLPYEVQEWAGMKDPQGTYDYDSTLGFCVQALSSDNDRGVTFPEIAATIRKVYEEL